MKRNLVCLLFVLTLMVPKVFAEAYTILTTEAIPYIITQQGPVEGIAIDAVHELFRRSNLEYEIKVQPLARVIKFAQQKGATHTCAMPIQRSQEREYFFSWVGPLLISQSAVFSLPNSKAEITVLKDVFQHKIGAIRGSDEAEYLVGFGAEIEQVPNDSANALKLSKGRMELWAADYITGSYYARLNQVDVKERLVFRTTLRALACNLETDPKVIELLNDNLSSMYADGTMQSIFTKNAKKFNLGEKGLIF